MQRCVRHKECHEAVTSAAGSSLEDVPVREEAVMQQFVGIDWATRRARWCAVTPAGAVIDEGWTPADEDGLARLVGAPGRARRWRAWR